MSAVWGWVLALVALAFALLYARQRWQLWRLQRWLADPTRAVPEAGGS